MHTYIYQSQGGLCPGECVVIVAESEKAAWAFLLDSPHRPIVNGKPWDKFELVTRLNGDRPGAHWVETQ